MSKYSKEAPPLSTIEPYPSQGLSLRHYVSSHNGTYV
jgi:hypothetical protein